MNLLVLIFQSHHIQSKLFFYLLGVVVMLPHTCFNSVLSIISISSQGGGEEVPPLIQQESSNYNYDDETSGVNKMI